MKWFTKKSNLDEMQELKLLKIESRGFWLGFLGLFLSILTQIFIYGPETAEKTLAGEFIILLCMGIYLVAGCLKNGIWDRHLQATPAVNIGFSFLAAAVTAAFNAVISYRNYHSAGGALAVFVVYFTMIGVALSVILCLCTVLYLRKRKQLEQEDDETPDGGDKPSPGSRQ